jgi:hypothetical protein
MTVGRTPTIQAELAWRPVWAGLTGEIEVADHGFARYSDPERHVFLNGETCKKGGTAE